MKQDDFEVQISAGSGQDYRVVVNSTAGRAEEIIRFPLDDVALERHLSAVKQAIVRSVGANRFGSLRRPAVVRRIQSPEGRAIRNFGGILFDALFRDDIRSNFELARADCEKSGAPLRIKLRIQDPKLAPLPWEYLYDTRREAFLSLSKQTPLIRWPEVPLPVRPLAIPRPLRMLCMVPSPANRDQLDSKQEKLKLEQALRRLRAEGRVELVWMERHSARDLQRVLRQGQWHVFHFIGHGGFSERYNEGMIVVEDENGNAQELRGEQLSTLLGDHGSLRLVVLNSCDGASAESTDLFSSVAANLMRRGIPAVIAMQNEVSDTAAIEFSQAFYEALLEGLPVDTALSEARKSIELSIPDTIEWGTPVLFMHMADGRLFADDKRLPARDGLSDTGKRRLRAKLESKQANEAPEARKHEDQPEERQAQDEQRAREEAERRRKEAAEEADRNQRAAEQLAKDEAERLAREEEERERREAEQRAKEEAERLAKEEEDRTRQEAEQRAKEEAERLAREEEERTRQEAEQRAKEEAERLAKEEEDRTRQEAEQRAKDEAQRLAKEEEDRKRQEAEQRAKEKAERLAREQEDRKRREDEQRAKEKAERLAKEKDERKLREAEQRAKKEAERLAAENASRILKEQGEKPPAGAVVETPKPDRRFSLKAVLLVIALTIVAVKMLEEKDPPPEAPPPVPAGQESVAPPPEPIATKAETPAPLPTPLPTITVTAPGPEPAVPSVAGDNDPTLPKISADAHAAIAAILKSANEETKASDAVLDALRNEPRASLAILQREQQAFARTRSQEARDLNTAGLKLVEAGDYAGAASEFRAAYARDPGDPEIAANAAYALMRQGNVATATPFALASLALMPNRATSWSNLGEIYATQGLEADAVNCFLLTNRHSRNRDSTRRYLEGLMANVNRSDYVRRAAETALSRLR